MKTYYALHLILVSVIAFAFCVQSAYAAPVSQAGNPAQQCAEGVQLFLQSKSSEALPLLEAGFNGREKASFIDPEDLGYCALALGILRRSTGNLNGALEAYQIALPIFRASQNRKVEGITLNNFGVVYRAQNQYAQSLDYYQQALAIHVEVGDRAGEGTALHNIGVVYESQGQYVQALDYFQQALNIARSFKGWRMPWWKSRSQIWGSF